MQDVFVYLSGPLTGANGYTHLDNLKSALPVYYECVKQGIPAFLPHLTVLCEGSFDINYELWMLQDFAVIDRSTHVLMLPRWESSPGAVREKYYAERRGIPIIYNLAELGV